MMQYESVTNQMDNTEIARNDNEQYREFVSIVADELIATLQCDGNDVMDVTNAIADANDAMAWANDNRPLVVVHIVVANDAPYAVGLETGNEFDLP